MTVVTAVVFSATLTAARGAAAVRGDDRGVVVDVGDRDGDGLGVGQGAVGDLHRDVVDIVAAGIGRALGVRRGDEGQRAGGGVDGELGGIGAADDASRSASRRHRASVAVTVVTAVVFSATLTQAVAPPPFEVMTGALSLTLVTVTAMAWVSVSGAVGDLDGDVVDIVAAGIGRALGVGRGDEGQRAGRWR